MKDQKYSVLRQLNKSTPCDQCLCFIFRTEKDCVYRRKGSYLIWLEQMRRLICAFPVLICVKAIFAERGCYNDRIDPRQKEKVSTGRMRTETSGRTLAKSHNLIRASAISIHCTISNISVSGQRRPRSDCADAQSDQGLHCLLIPRWHIFTRHGTV